MLSFAERRMKWNKYALFSFLCGIIVGMGISILLIVFVTNGVERSWSGFHLNKWKKNSSVSWWYKATQYSFLKVGHVVTGPLHVGRVKKSSFEREWGWYTRLASSSLTCTRPRSITAAAIHRQHAVLNSSLLLVRKRQSNKDVYAREESANVTLVSPRFHSPAQHRSG